MSTLRLNVGCGDRPLPGFVNIDVEHGADVQHDARDGLPFEDGCVDAVYSEHFIEHIDQADGVRFLRECRRVLRPGGRVRIATPDLDAVVRDYTSEHWLHDEWKRWGYDWIQNRCEMLNLGMREWGHRWVYNEEELVRLGRIAGLEFVERCDIGRSRDPGLCGLEHRAGSRLIVEFVKPNPLALDDPLVSIVITAFNPRFYDEALQSAMAQTWPNLEIVVGDDDPTGEIERITGELAGDDPRVRYTRNDPRLGGPDNRIACFERAQGDYVKFLNDDDLLHPECVERMARCLIAHGDVTLVTSHRRRIDADGAALDDESSTERPVAEDSKLSGTSVAGRMLAKRMNFVGEPSTVMFRKADLTDATPHILSFAGRPCIPNGDVTMWTHLLSKGEAIYLVDSLSSFRIHDQQMQRKQGYADIANEAWEQLTFDAKRMGLMPFDPDAELEAAPLGARPWWPQDALSRIVDANAALERGELEPAADGLADALETVGDDPWLLNLHGLLLEQLGRNMDAAQAFERARLASER